MRTRDPLHWSALLYGVAALSWGLTLVGPIAGIAAGLALAAGLAASAVGILAGLRHHGAARGPLLGGALLVGLLHTVFVIAFIGATPLNFKGEPGRGVNQEPSAIFSWLIDNVATWIPILLAAAVVLAFWMLWSSRDRGLGVGSLAVILGVLVLSLLGIGDASAAVGTIYQVLFAVGYVALAAACLLPVLLDDDWPDAARHDMA